MLKQSPACRGFFIACYNHRMSTITRKIDLHDHQQRMDYIAMLRAYSEDPLGQGFALSDEILQKTTTDLATLPHAIAFVAYDLNTPVGFATCLAGYSTFRAKPLWNIHDIAVIPTHRRRGIATQILETIRQHADHEGCCKITLEVREDNPQADRLYRQFGFQSIQQRDEEIPYRFLALEL